MEHITTSRTAMALLVVAAFIYAFGIAFAIGGYAALTPTTFGTAIGLLHAAGWLRAVGWAAALAAVCVAGRELLLRGAWASACEVGTRALGALLITIGMLINATSAESNSAFGRCWPSAGQRAAHSAGKSQPARGWARCHARECFGSSPRPAFLSWPSVPA
jgi:hypothetical protein